MPNRYTFPESNPLPVIEMTEEGKITFMNKAARDCFPYLDKTPLDAAWEVAIAEARRSGASTMREVSINRRIWYQLAFNWIEKDKRLRVFGMDITARKMIEFELKQERNKLHLAFEHNIAMMSIVRLSDGAIIDVNEAWLKDFGLSKEEVLGRTSTELGLWKDQEKRDLLFERFKNTHDPITYEAEFVSRDGRVWRSVTHAEIVFLEGEQHVLTSGIDVSRLRKLEAVADDLT